MNAEPRTIVIAAVVSLLVHAALAIGIYDLPLGKVDPALLQTQEVFRVYRTPDDLVIDDAPSVDVLGPLDEQTLATDLAAMSLSLLAEASPADPLDMAAAPERTVELREAETERDIETVEAMPVDLPDVVQQEFIGPPPAPLESGAGGLAGEGDGTGAGVNVDVQPGTGAATARDFLADAGFAPVHDPLPPTRPHIVEFTPVEQRIVEAAPARPAIDFAAIALENTTQLDIPEHLDHDFEYSIRVFHDRRSRVEPTKYFEIEIAAKRTLTKLPTMPKDVVYLIDTSGSVSQMWVDQTLRGVRDALSSLNPDDRFNIVLFNEKVSSFSAEGSVEATEANIAAARAFTVDAKSQGWTDVNRAMARLLVRDVAVERAYNLILISDGLSTRGVTDTRELINLITRDNAFASSIYCIGIGTRQNHELLDFLSYRNKGFSVYVRDHTEAAAAVRDLASRLRYPIMKDVRLTTVGLDSTDIYPLDLPNIHQGERFRIYGTFNQAQPFTMRVTGHNGRTALDFTHSFELRAAPMGEQTIARDWAFWKLHHLYSRIIQEGERKSIMDEIKALQRRYNLKTLY